MVFLYEKGEKIEETNVKQALNQAAKETDRALEIANRAKSNMKQLKRGFSS